MRLRVLLVVGILAALVPQGGARAAACTDDVDATFGTEDLVGLSGLYALPAAAPTQLVVFNHGYGNSARTAWSGHLSEAAGRHGALAFAIDGTGVSPDLRGWPVRTGAAESIDTARYFLARCPSITQVFVLGVSMGGNTSGLLVAAGATKTNGYPLVDYWIDVEGVTNVLETYAEGTAVAHPAGADIEAAFGGTPADRPDVYLDSTVVLRAADIAAGGLRGAVIVHGADDGTVPYDQSREMAAALLGVGVATDVYTVLGRGEGEAGTTMTGHVGNPLFAAAGEDYPNPNAGHGWEGSSTHLVIRTGLEKLWGLMDGAAPGPYREFVVHGDVTIP